MLPPFKVFRKLLFLIETTVLSMSTLSQEKFYGSIFEGILPTGEAFLRLSLSSYLKEPPVSML